MLHGQRPKLYGAGLNVRDWIHVDDHNSAVWAIIDRGRMGETYLIGADGETDNLTVVRTVLYLMGLPADEFDHVSATAQVTTFACDRRLAAARRAWGWEPRFGDFRSGLAATIDWYRANEAWWRPAKLAAEDSEYGGWAGGAVPRGGRAADS